jgi:Tfp pilus assembly protein FimV
LVSRVMNAGWLLGMALAAWAAAPASPVQAAETSASAAAALKVLALPLGDDPHPAHANTPSGTAHGNPLPQGRSITVQKGESIDAVIRRGLPGLPLKDDFMRLALAKANPKIFPRGQTYPVRPGTVLTLPSPEELRQLIVSRHPEAAILFQAPPTISAVSDEPPGPDKRGWVRFP